MSATDKQEAIAACEREAAVCRQRAERLARRGLVFSAGDQSDLAVAHEREAARLRLILLGDSDAS